MRSYAIIFDKVDNFAFIIFAQNLTNLQDVWSMYLIFTQFMQPYMAKIMIICIASWLN